VASDDDGTPVPEFGFVDLFAGAGGLTLGFRDERGEPGARFFPRLLVDIDRDARDVVNENAPEVRYLIRDIRKLAGSEVRELMSLPRQERLHVLVGGPPCQGFSGLGRRALDDERNAHVLDFLRLVKELRPLAVLMENVPLVITAHKGAIIQEICDGLGVLGYASCADILIASDFGVPQFRKRAFVLAYHSDLGVVPEFPHRTYERIPVAASLMNGGRRRRFEPSKLPYVCVEDAIGDLPALEANDGSEVMFYPTAPASDYQTWAREGAIALFNHRSRAHSETFLAKIAVIEEGGRNAGLPDEQRFSDNYYSQAYARLHRNGIGQTVTTWFSNPGSGRFTHYRDLRAITVREAARFQSFPDRFVFGGGNETQMRHVGNAVPPLLARALRDQIARDFLLAGVGKPRSPGRPRKLVPTQAPEVRPRIMRAVKGKNTGVEVALRKALWAAGLRGYRLHSSKAPGNPDVVFSRQHVAVFVDGCFWHGCPRCYRAPKSNTEYWEMKVARNRDRDARVNMSCKEAGWKVVRLWEHDVVRAPERAAKRVERAVNTARRRGASRGRRK